MAKQKRSLLDDLASRVRGLIDDLGRLMNPQPYAKPVRVRVPIPIPVQPQRRSRYDDPYRY